MQLAPSSFDPETVAMMGRVCDGAWNEATNRLSLFSGRTRLACAMSSPCASWPPLPMASEIRINSG